MADEQKGFWTSMPGILTGLATVLTAITGLYLAISGDGRNGQDGQLPAVPTVPAPGKSGAEQPLPSQLSPRPQDIFRLSAFIDDPDGFTLVRSQKSASSQVVARVNQGEPFFTYTQDGNWWQVMTRDGKVGYMHVSRIKIIAPR